MRGREWHSSYSSFSTRRDKILSLVVIDTSEEMWTVSTNLLYYRTKKKKKNNIVGYHKSFGIVVSLVSMEGSWAFTILY